MDETILYLDDDPLASGRGLPIHRKGSPTVTVFPGRLKVDDEYYSLVGVLKSSVQTDVFLESNDDRTARIIAWTLIVLCLMIKGCILYYQFEHSLILNPEEMFSGWWIVVCLYVFIVCLKYSDEAKKYHKADIVLKRADEEVRITIASYLPKVSVSNERSFRWGKNPEDYKENQRKRTKAFYEANIVRVNKISEAVGKAIR